MGGKTSSPVSHLLFAAVAQGVGLSSVADTCTQTPLHAHACCRGEARAFRTLLCSCDGQPPPGRGGSAVVPTGVVNAAGVPVKITERFTTTRSPRSAESSQVSRWAGWAIDPPGQKRMPLQAVMVRACPAGAPCTGVL